MTSRQEPDMDELERMVAMMAKAIPDLDCPEQCECTWVYHYMERSAQLYREELEWACLAEALIKYRQSRGKGNPGSG
ncbi:MAG TPA: hypothetical protein VFF81_08125 [Noviherbaspirillum sp.]|nr:hypothetical protein [Noviherbaspirillum sp.]